MQSNRYYHFIIFLIGAAVFFSPASMLPVFADTHQPGNQYSDQSYEQIDVESTTLRHLEQEDSELLDEEYRTITDNPQQDETWPPDEVEETVNDEHPQENEYPEEINTRPGKYENNTYSTEESNSDDENSNTEEY